MTFDDFLALHPEAQKRGGEWYLPCPCHKPDTNWSLRFKPGDKQPIVFTCGAGCPQEQILAAYELTWKDVSVPTNGAKPSFAAVYRYDDEQGHPLLEVCRTIDKQFPQRRPGAEQWGVKGVRRVLYGLPEMLRAPPGAWIAIAEGEKDVASLRAAGLIATTNLMGAGCWRQEYTDWLRSKLPDRKFCILPDNDEAGLKHADEVFNSLRHAKLTARVLLLPDLPPKGDVTDWLREHSAEELRRLIDPSLSWREGEIDGQALMRRQFIPLHWAIDHVLPEGLAVFAGPSKSCKSWLCCEICLAVIFGGKVFGQLQARKGEVLYLALEDSERRLQDRFITLLRGQEMAAGLTARVDCPRMGEGAEELIEDWLKRHPDARLVIIDVLQKIRPPKKPGASEYEQDYAALSPLQRICRDYRVCILIVHHTRKAQADDPYDMISGSTAIQGAADTMLALMRLRGEVDATLHYTGRDVEADALALQWREQECGWNLLGKAKDNRLSRERTSILEFLAQAKEDVGPSEAAAWLEMNASTVRTLLAKLVTDGSVMKTSYGKYRISEGEKERYQAARKQSKTPQTPGTQQTL